MRMRVHREKLRVEWEWEFWKEKMRSKLRMSLLILKNEGLIETKSASFMTLHIKIFIQNCSEMLEKLPLQSTKFNLDVSDFWEFENESWECEWEFSQKNWESRLRMRWEFSLRVSISRSRWESRRSLRPGIGIARNWLIAMHGKCIKLLSRTKIPS